MTIRFINYKNNLLSKYDFLENHNYEFLEQNSDDEICLKKPRLESTRV